MSTGADPELLSFAIDLIEQRGGLVECLPDRVLALLPPSLAKLFGLPEETPLGAEETPLLYGSPFLERLVDAATVQIPVVYGQIEVPYLKKAGFGELKAIWNPLTRQLDPLVCERCHHTIRKIQPVATDSGFELLCFRCAQKR